MRRRLAARLLILDADDRLLLFKFVFARGPLSGTTFWATPGGGVEDGETFQQAAVRELREETGLDVSDLGPEVARREATFLSPEGETILADERYFLLRPNHVHLSSTGWTPLERQVMVEHRWWTLEDIRRSDEQIWPETLVEILLAADPCKGPRAASVS